MELKKDFFSVRSSCINVHIIIITKAQRMSCLSLSINVNHYVEIIVCIEKKISFFFFFFCVLISMPLILLMKITTRLFWNEELIYSLPDVYYLKFYVRSISSEKSGFGSSYPFSIVLQIIITEKKSNNEKIFIQFFLPNDF